MERYPIQMSEKSENCDSLTAMKRWNGRLTFLAAGLGALLATGTVWAAPPETFGVEGPAAYKALKAVRLTPSETMGIDLGTVPAVRLPAVDRDALLREDAAASRETKAKGLRYGVGRDLQLSARDGEWYDLAHGSRLWVGEIVAADALGLRLHFQNVHLPAGAELAVYAPLAGYSPDEAAQGTARSGFPRFDPDRDVEQYESAAEPGFWTGTFAGERVRIEYLSPTEYLSPADVRELPFTVDGLQHLYRDPVAELAEGLTAKTAGPCHNDVSCYPEWAQTARAVSGVGVINKNSLFCTGELLDDQAHDLTPYWLTAQHCVGSATQAKSAEIYWLYQTARCNGAPPSLRSVPHSLGTTLLASSRASDFSLLMVEGALPAGLYWSGWTAAQVADGTPAAVIQHPRGDYKRISFGFKDAGTACQRENPDLIRISWTNGPTEPGSSGSGIFRDDTHQLFGQLSDGPSACGKETYDCFGAFAFTYPQIKNLLRQGSDDNSAPNGSCAQARAVSAGTLRNRIVKIGSPDWYSISVPAGRTVSVRLAFRNADGDVDLAAFTACGGAPVATSAGMGDGEQITFSNRRAQPVVVSWRVDLAADTRNQYDMTVAIR
jgi:lysyl endopeptidase